MPQRYVIVGNGIAGTTCAETLRTEDPTCSVTLVGLEPYPLYNRVSLPRYIKGLPRERVLLRTVEEHKERGIDLRLERTATSLDTAAKTIHFDDGSELPYDALTICPGGHPEPYPAPGADQVRALTYAFQTLDDTAAIIEKCDQSHDSVVIGGSFIAYELAEGFRHRGLNVTWIQRGPRFLRRVLDEEGGQMVDFLAKEAGVVTVYNQEVEAVAALNMLGRRVEYREVPTYTTSMFKSTLAVMGITPENTGELESVTRLDLPNRLYRALFFYKGRIAGAVLIGTPKGRKKLIEMMVAGQEIPADKREALLDPTNLID